jgi:hypothetical protein
MSRTLGLLGVAVLMITAARAASSADAAGPDIVGFRPGMSAQEAYTKLKQYAGPARNIKAGRWSLPDLSAKPIIFELDMSDGDVNNSAEVVQLDLTLPPAPQVVWRIVRQLKFQPGKEMLPQNVAATVQEKYGPPEQQMTPTVPGFWWFAPNGQRASLPPGLPGFNNCNSFGPGPRLNGLGNNADTVVIGLPQPIQRREAWVEQCRAFTKVCAALLTIPSQELVRGLVVELADLALEARTRDATMQALAKAANGREQQVLDRANSQEKPKL